MTMVFPATVSKISSGQLRGGLRALVLVATSKSFPVIGTVPCPSPSQTPFPRTRLLPNLARILLQRVRGEATHISTGMPG